MKKIILSITLMLGVSFAQGVPTTDAGALINLRESLKIYQEQLDSVKGITKGIGGFLNSAQDILKEVDNLENWLSRQADIRKYGKDILSSELRKIYDSYELDSYCSNYEGNELGSLKRNCEGQIILAAVKQQELQNNINNLKNRIEKIQGLEKRIENAETQKEAQDLSNSLQVQMSLLQADQLMLSIKQSEEELTQYLNELQEESTIKELNSERTITLPDPNSSEWRSIDYLFKP